MAVSPSPLAQEGGLVHIATLKRPYGIKGWLWVFSHMDDRKDVFNLPWFVRKGVDCIRLTPSKWRKQGAGLVACFSEVPDRTAAERLIGTKIYTYSHYLPALEDDEVYWQDLIGLDVVDLEGILLGQVHSLFETPAHAILQIDGVDEKTHLIPWHDRTIQEVLQDDGRIVVDWNLDY